MFKEQPPRKANPMLSGKEVTVAQRITQRSVQTELSPMIIIRAGLDVRVRVAADVRVVATTKSRWGLKVERHGQSVEVNIGSSGDVSVPVNSSIKVYAGKTADIEGVQGNVTVHAGGKAHIRDVDTLLHVSAGGGLDFECKQVSGDNLKFRAGGSLHGHIRSLTDAHLLINDMRGFWEGIIGSGRTKIAFKAGGDVTIVSDHKIVVKPPQDPQG